MYPPLDIADDVRDALAKGRPVVALESMIITGKLYPENAELATAIEKAVREADAVPATVGIADGRFLVGMTADQLDRFASTPRVPKVSSRDIGAVLAGGGLGATTVASTLVVADLAGIPVFSTAGIGGVHRGASTTFDVSADLVQFTRSKTAVVCAGAKNILDLGLTLEYLETLGVPVIGYRCDDFPAFYCRSSGFRNPKRLDDLMSIARAVLAHWAAGLPGGPIITAPIEEDAALDEEWLDRIITDALDKADEDGITGAAVTPYLLKAVAAETGGASTVANRAVLISTARLAGHVAVAVAEQAERDESGER